MTPCRNCGNINPPGASYCRTCGSKLANSAPVPKPPGHTEFEMPSPRPYSWKTDEFSTKNEPRGTMPINESSRGADLAPAQPQFLASFRCPNCNTHLPPLLERKISTAGWITFGVLLVTVFPLFWIGLLIREDVPICQICQAKLSLGPYR